MDSAGGFMPELMERLCAVLYASGVDGVYVCGQTGEGLQQPVAQRKLVVETTVRATPAGKTVMAHIGAGSTADAVELARHAESCGAHAISALPPGGSYSIEEVHGYYSSIASATSLPLFIYFFPAFAARPGGYGDLMRLCEIPGVAGLKFTSTDLFTMWKLKRAGATIFNGFDEIFVAGLAMGADGGIGTFYNVVPEWFVGIHRLAREGKWEEARILQGKVNAVIEIGLQYPMHAGVKEMMAWQGVPCGDCRAPRANLTAEQKRSLRAKLEGMDLPRRG
jgi:N-acetylneuraminate lyase